jgi:uncharacterized Zn-finger protein
VCSESYEGRVQCEICLKWFASAKIALKHVEEVHLAERPHPCPNVEAGCPLTFKRTSHSKRHSNICPYNKVTLFLSVSYSPVVKNCMEK